MAKEKEKSTIYVTKNGINLTEGLFIVQNMRTKQINLITIDTKSGNASLFAKTKTLKIADIIKLESVNEILVLGDAKINIRPNKS